MTTQTLTDNVNEAPSSANILIIEDNSISAAALEALLQDNGITNIFVANSSEEAIKLFSKKIDLIFMDLNLPDTNGFKLTQHYRKVFPKMDTPIICWSTLAEAQRKKCIEAGMDDFLPKPATLEDIKDILECWVPHRIVRTK